MGFYDYPMLRTPQRGSSDITSTNGEAVDGIQLKSCRRAPSEEDQPQRSAKRKSDIALFPSHTLVPGKFKCSCWTKLVAEQATLLEASFRLYCLEPACAVFFCPTLRTGSRYFDFESFPRTGRIPSRLRGGQLPLLVKGIQTYINYYRLSSGYVNKTLKTPEQIGFQSQVPCDDLSDILGIPVTDPSVLVKNMQTSFFPTKDGESYTLEQSKKLNRSIRETIARAKKYTEELVNLIKSSSPGPVCLIIRSLDGFSCHVVRILSFLCHLRRLRLGYTLKFMHLIGERKPLPADCAPLKGGGWCASGFYPVFFSADELLEGTSDIVKIVKKAWD
jgi:hypothetical protein